MNIVLCVKAVPSKLIYADTKHCEELSINPYDVFALKQLVSLKQEMDCNITCLCMGKGSAESVLTRCLALGADHAILLNDIAFAGADTFATTYTLSEAIKRVEYDLVVCGDYAVDGETGQVSYGLAQRLGVPCFANVSSIDGMEDKAVKVTQKQYETLYHYEVQMPAVIAFNDLCMTTNPSLLALRKAKKVVIDKWDREELGLEVQDCGQKGSKTYVIHSQGKTKDSCKNTIFITEKDEQIKFLFDKIDPL